MLLMLNKVKLLKETDTQGRLRKQINPPQNQHIFTSVAQILSIMACGGDPSDDFSNLSLGKPDLESSSFNSILKAYGDSEQEDDSLDSDNDINEKYTFEDREKDHLADTARELKLRDYQFKLAAKSLTGRNTIIWAPTGSGKTTVATYIIQEHLKQSCGTEKKVAFLAGVVSLADQQYKYLSKYLPSYKITLITGDSSNCMSLHLSIPANDIIVMTPMILENNLRNKNVLHLGVFSLIIFDECHHTRKGEPYNTLMRFYHKTKYGNNQAKSRGENVNISLPQIVGLTASIGVEGAEILDNAINNILKVCANLDALEVSTIDDDDGKEIKQFVAVSKEESMLLEERPDDDSVLKIIEVMEKLEKHMEKYVADLQYGKLDVAIRARPANRKTQEYEQWTKCTIKTAKAMPLIFSESTEKTISRRLIIIAGNYLKEYRCALETYNLVELENIVEYLENSFKDLKQHEERITEENVFYTYFLELKEYMLSSHYEENPNLSILAQTLMKYLIQMDSRCIVFVRTRALAVALSMWLNKCSIKELRDLKASSFTGTNMPEQKGGTSQAKQESIIHMFREGFVRLIVSTSVAEEGLDIPSCSLVIKYNHVGNEVTTVQSRGRSRAFGGITILLAMNNVLQRERVNQRRAELMRKAIEGIRKMKQLEFEAAIALKQKELLEEMLLADMMEFARQKQVQPFEILCSLCRKVSIQSKNVRTIYGKYRISIDRNLLKKTRSYPMEEFTMDEILFVGAVRCLGENVPGKKCLHPLGTMIKYKRIHFITIGIQNVVFNIGNNQELRQYKQWKKVPFFINELSHDDILRYITVTDLGEKFPDTATDDNKETDDEDTDNDDDDEETKDDRLGDRINNMQQNRRNSDTEVKKAY